MYPQRFLLFSSHQEMQKEWVRQELKDSLWGSAKTLIPGAHITRTIARATTLPTCLNTARIHANSAPLPLPVQTITSMQPAVPFGHSQ